MNKRLVTYSLTVVLVSLPIVMCNTRQTVSTEDIPAGNFVGKITDVDGSPVEGASVILVSEGFMPISAESENGVLDSTLSNSSGYYSFDVGKSGKYNLLANNNKNYTLRKAIPVNASAQLDLPDEQLIPPGSLGGTVHLQSMDNHQSAVILLPGTNMFTYPSDASGDFMIPELAEGSYDLRIVSTESVFAVVETTVTVISEEQTMLPLITLLRKRVPVIDEFSVVYDPLMMEATLFWKTSDADIIDSFHLYCNREQNIRPVLTFDGNVTTYTIDLILDSIMTRTYQIAAVGEDGWEGEAVTGEPFTNNSVITTVEIKFPEEIVGAKATSTEIFHFNENGVYYFRHDHMDSVYQIYKMNQDLSFEKSVSYPGVLSVFGKNAVSDMDGNLYYIKQVLNKVSDTQMDLENNIVKVDHDLNLVDEHPITVRNGPQSISMAVSSAGTLILYRTNGFVLGEPEADDTTYVTVFAPDFSVISETYYNDFREIRQSLNANDSVVTIIASNAWEQEKLFYFDASFNEIHSVNPLEGQKFPALEGFIPVEGVVLCSENLFIMGFSSMDESLPMDESSILGFFNKNNEILARYAYKGHFSNKLYENYGFISPDGIFSNTDGYLYAFKYDYEMERYSIDKIFEMAKR